MQGKYNYYPRLGAKFMGIILLSNNPHSYDASQMLLEFQELI